MMLDRLGRPGAATLVLAAMPDVPADSGIRTPTSAQQGTTDEVTDETVQAI